MERIAFIYGEVFLYWSPIILTAAVLASVCMFLSLRIFTAEKVTGAFLTVPVALGLSMVLGRFVHWYCRPDSYAGFAEAMTNYSSGNYALVGVFAGCLLAACLMRLLRIEGDLPMTLDCMAIAGSLGICVGRLNHMYNSFDRGQIVEGIKSLPIVYPVTNTVSGELEYRFATFMIQAVVAGLLFAGLLTFFLVGRAKKKLRAGDTCLLFMLFYGASQVVLDSTRYDSLFFRSNGFVSMVQILAAVIMGVAIIIYSLRMVSLTGMKKWYAAPWVAIVGLLVCAGIMEYYVQRRGSDALIYHSIMTACLVAVIGITLLIRHLSIHGKPRPRRKLKRPIIPEEDNA